MVFRPRTGLFAFFFFAGVLLSAFSQSVTKTDRTADGAGAIVFDTSKLPELTGDEAVSLFDFSLGDKRVEFLAQGYWQSTISSTSTYTFGFGSTPGFSFGTPVFAQKVDLSLWFMLDRHWYFEADFADEFTKNTVAAGYVGDGVVQSVRIANRGITFPGIYAVDDVNRGIGGGDNQAPGLSVHLQGEKWQAHAAVRYDMLKSEEKTWYGKNAVSTNAIALSQYVTGSRYVLPSQEAVQAVRDVYVENANGSYRDAQGRTYKKLDASQYLLVPSSYTVLLAKDAGAAKTNGVLPAVAFRFDGMTADSVAASAADLIADVRAWFESDANPELADVTQFFFDLRTNPSAATAGEQFVSAIDGERVLFVQHSAGFSPFVVAYRYDAGLTTATDAAITSRQSDVTVTDYAAVIGEDDISFVSEDFFYTTHTYADVYCTDEPEADMRSAAVRFPLARADAGIYLGYGQHSDWELSVRTYTPVARFDIGTDAVPGTVRVYKNGILDSGATYDSESGSITLSSAVAASDHIYATWYEDSEDAESGAIAAAAGFAYRPTDTVTTDVSLAARWSLTPQKDFADADYTSPGFATLAGRISYEGEHLTLANTVAASVESENTTGTYRILGMDDTTADTVYLAKNAAVALPDGFVPVLNTRTETEPFPELTADKNGSQPAQDGLTDAAISGYAVPVAWNFSDSAGVTVDSPAWAAVAIRLPGAENSLASASTFSFWLKNPDATNADFSVYVQLGVEAADDVSLENVTTIPTWRVSTANGEANPADVRAAFYPALDPALSGTGGWQPVTVVLSDRDRARLAYYHDARIIITSQTASAGEILVGPYQADGVSFTVTHNAATMVSSCQTTDGTLVAQEVNAFNTGVNYVQQCTWKTYGEAAVERLSADDTFTLTFSRYFAEVDMQHYEELALWFQYNPQDAAPVPSGCMAEISDDALTLVLDRPADGGTDQTAVKITLHRSDLSASSLWHRLSVDMAAKTVQIDGVNVGSAYVNTAVVPVRFQVMLNTADAAQRTYYQSGTFAVDELFLDETQPYVVLQDKARAAWKKGGTVLEHNGAVILRDVLLAATGTGSRTIQTGGSGSDGGMLASTAQAAFTLAELRITGDAAFSSAATKPLASAAHTVATDTPLFGVIDISESYGYSAEDASLEKANAVSFDFATLGIPISIAAQTEAQSNAFALTQRASATAKTQVGAVEWSAKAGVGQKMLPSASDVSLLRADSYGRGWLEATHLAFDTGDARASRRSLTAETSLAVRMPWYQWKPVITAKTGGAYTSSASTRFADDTVCSVSLPFAVGVHRFSFTWKKSGGGVNLVSKGGGYARDMGLLRDAYGNIGWFFSAFPLYDLISADLASAVLADASLTSSSAESCYYSGGYEVSWKRGFYGNRYDVLLPAQVTLAVQRDIRTAATTADVYQLKSTVGYTALNVFGITGSIPLATWFQQDEYAASLTAALKIPRHAPRNISMLYTGYVQANFFVSASHAWKTGVEGSFEDADNWSGKLTAVWKRLSARSPVVSAIALFRPSYRPDPSALTRTDSVNIGASRTKAAAATSATQKINAEYTHALDIAVTKYVTINTLLGASYACTWDKIVTVSATMCLGGTVQF